MYRDTTGGLILEEQLTLFCVEDSTKEITKETKVCSQCKKDLPLNKSYFDPNVNNKGEVDRYKHICKKCVAENRRVINKIRLTAPSVPECCELCGIHFSRVKPRDIHLDHCHDNETFRGWLCKSCNVGLGMLGDNTEGLQRAMDYLERVREHNEPRKRSA